MEQEHVHQKAIRSLAVHPSKGNYFATGSTDGTVKMWTYSHGRPTAHAHLTNMHPTHTFMNGATSDSLISQRGTTDLAFSRDFLLTCGADGNVKITPLSSLMV
jgi:WD40 repeat protein